MQIIETLIFKVLPPQIIGLNLILLGLNRILGSLEFRGGIFGIGKLLCISKTHIYGSCEEHGA